MIRLERLPEVCEAVLAALRTWPDGRTAEKIADAIGEEYPITVAACRKLRADGQVTWVRQSGSREWLVRRAEGVTFSPPAADFVAFAREMGFARGEIIVRQADRVAA